MTQNEALELWREYMLAGDFEAAWRVSDEVRPAVWNGAPLHGKTVLVRCENGLGDTIQFMRYAPMLRRICAGLAVDVQPNLRSLLQFVAGVHPEPIAAPEVEIECTELPYAFRSTLATIPAEVPYIHVPRPRGFRNGCRRVGLVWASGPWNPDRSIPLESFAPLGEIPGVAWVPLQHGPACSDLTRADGLLNFTTLRPPCDDDALRTAREILALDLVITVDTMVAHLAGALGKPVWTLLPYEADWRWMRHRDDSPWYPTMRLFRQQYPGDWPGVIERVKEALALFHA